LNRKWLEGRTAAAVKWEASRTVVFSLLCGLHLLQIMTGNSILKDGRSVVEVYGIDLDKLKEGDRIGVMKTSEVMAHGTVQLSLGSATVQLQ
jgi:hypothetical protein